MTIEEISHAILPKEIANAFLITEIKEEKESTVFILHEKEELIPDILKGKEVVLDGFCNPVEILHFPLNGKRLYLKTYRRRWKEKNTTKHYSNEYDLHPEGMKATKAFGAFLKENF